MKTPYSRALLPMLLAVAALPLGADRNMNIATSTAPDFQAIRATIPPAIDGRLDDEAWSAAASITGFTQRDPDEGKPATENTVVKVIYDDEAIYFGARLHDSGRVTTRLARRDSDVESDWFRVYLDPHLDRRTGASFWVNPSNVQYDMVLYNDSWSDSNWDGVWSSATTVDEGGWTVEMRIPYSQLRFPDREQHTWGLNFGRVISRINEHSRLVHVPKTETGFVSRFARLNGIAGIKPKKSFEILPYVVTRADFRNTVSSSDPLNSSSEYGGDAGLDVKYGITSNLTLTGTINPDFGQVEVDPAVVNLTQFELFFPEKRPFFVEGSSLFEFGRGGSNHNFGFNFSTPQFFYSRRIGRNPQGVGGLSYDYLDAPEQSTILGAAKLTGKTGNGWTIAALDAVTQEEKASFQIDGLRSSQVVEPMTNYLVLRSAKDLSEKGRVGFLATAVNRDLPDSLESLRTNAYSGGIDGHWFFGKKDVILEWFAGGSLVEGSAESIELTQRSAARYFQRPDADHVELDPGRTSLDGWAGRVMFAKQTGKWRYNIQGQAYSPGFETNDVGFMQRSDVQGGHAVLLYNNADPWKSTRSRNFWVASYHNRNFDGDKIGEGFLGDGYLQLSNFWYLYYWGGMNTETVDDRATRGGPVTLRPSSQWAGGGFGTDSRKRYWAELFFETSQNARDGHAHFLQLALNYKPATNLSVSLVPTFRDSRGFAQYVRTTQDPLATHTFGNRYVFAQIDQRSLELTTRIDWTFSSRLSFQLYLQPFVASGDYSEFKELARARSLDYAEYGVDAGTIVFDEGDNRYEVDPDGSGPAGAFAFANPDFNLRSIRANAIVRWEFRPGSALYLVWNENRQDVIDRGDFSLRRDLSGSFDAPSDDVFLVKMSYWLGL